MSFVYLFSLPMENRIGLRCTLCIVCCLLDWFFIPVEAPETRKETTRPGVWRCPICTFDNEDSMSSCDICGVLRNPLVNARSSINKNTGNLNLTLMFFFSISWMWWSELLYGYPYVNPYFMWRALFTTFLLEVSHSPPFKHNPHANNPKLLLSGPHAGSSHPCRHKLLSCILVIGFISFSFPLYRVDLFHAVDGMSKYSGASVMAKSLFESLQRSTPNKTLTSQRLTDEFLMDECNSSCKPGEHSNELHRIFSQQKHHRFNIGVHVFQDMMLNCGYDMSIISC